MQRSKICLCLTGNTIQEDLDIIETYRNYIDIVELRVDYLSSDEKLHIRKFPELAGIPCILTIRRKADGGLYDAGEAARTTLFARALAYAEQDVRKNFAYIDMENDFYVSSLQDAALAFGTKIIRSYHDMNGMVYNIEEMMKKMRTTGFEIPKIACMPQSLSDVTQMLKQSKSITDFDHILIAMGPLGQPTRILANKMNSCITYVSPKKEGSLLSEIGQLDPITLNEVYNFKNIDERTTIYGITGYPLVATASPELHNSGYKAKNMNSVYIPVRAKKIEEALEFAEEVGIQGLSVTVPHKEDVIPHLITVSEEVGDIGASNTIIKHGEEWIGYNTDAEGFHNSLLEFLGTKNLKRWKVAIIGAGGAARAIAYVVKKLKGKACIFNRTLSKAKSLAQEYGFDYAPLSSESLSKLELYSSLIIQSTSIGLGVGEKEISTPENDPLSFYNFKGYEYVYDVIYHPQVTPILNRAQMSGCKTINGFNMLKYQGYKQFELFTGVKYEDS